MNDITMVKIKMANIIAGLIVFLISMWIGNGVLMFVTCITTIVSIYIALIDPNFVEYYESKKD